MKSPTDTNLVSDAVLEMADSFAHVVKERPLPVLSVWFGTFSLLFGLSLMLGIVPELDLDDEEATAEAQELEADEVAEREAIAAAKLAEEDSSPTRIIIDRIGVDSTILTPESRAIPALDEALLEGVVHYPGSADLAEEGNVFLFGHSTGFRVVQNPAYKVFNELKNLEHNDIIRVQSEGREYVYRVSSLSLVNADEAFVDLSKNGRRLTLSTCNTFGAKQERYVVEAEFVGDYPIGDSS